MSEIEEKKKSGHEVNIDIEEEGAPERGQWGSQIEFILTCVGYAVGLGNVWRFPYLCYRNGGGAFLVPYFIMLAFVGIPIFFLELSFGQFASLGPLAIWKVNPLLKGLGYAMVITNTLIALSYIIIIAWSIYYFFASMTDQLPWEFCDNWWNTPLCVNTDDMKDMEGNESHVMLNDTWYLREEIKTPSEDYYYHQVLRISDGIDNLGPIVWQLALCLLLAFVCVFFVLIKGISSLGKVVYFTSTFPYILLTIMLIRGVTLEGATTGLEFYLIPDWERLSDANVWSDAATQIFYSLSACTGGLIAMASYNAFKNNVYRDSIMVPCINCGTSFYAGFVIFSVLGFMAHEKGVSVDDVADDGPGLVFIAYPEALTQMPVAPLWAILFFLMLISLGFSSEFSMMECFFSSFMDEFPGLLRRSTATNIAFRAIVTISFYLLCLPMVTEGGFYLFNLVDVSIGGYPLLFIGLFEVIGVIYIYGYRLFCEDIFMMIGRKPPMYFSFMWICITPLILFFVIVFMCIQDEPLWLEDYEYPVWANVIGWLIVLFPLIFIPGWFLGQYLYDGGWTLLVDLSKETPEWGPSNKADRTGRYAMKDEKVDPNPQIVPSVTETSFINKYPGGSITGTGGSMLRYRPGSGASNGGIVMDPRALEEVKLKDGETTTVDPPPTDKEELAPQQQHPQPQQQQPMMMAPPVMMYDNAAGRPASQPWVMGPGGQPVVMGYMPANYPVTQPQAVVQQPAPPPQEQSAPPKEEPLYAEVDRSSKISMRSDSVPQGDQAAEGHENAAFAQDDDDDDATKL